MLKNYQRLPNGVIKQIATNPFVYDPEYIEVYNKYGDARIKMAWMRMGYITGVIGNPSTLIDVGYGNGDFLRAAREFTECYGHDINEYPIPEGCRFMDDWKNFDGDVMTFFDVLEHIPDISFVKDLKAKYIVISVPNCHYESEQWFESWKHRKPDEHLWHFNEQSLINFMNENGYIYLNISHIEDAIRKGDDKKPNIITGIFQKV